MTHQPNIMQRQEKLSIVFMGTPGCAVPVLAALLDAGHDIIGVYTQPDRPAGRGRRPAAPEIKRFALDRELIVLQPSSLKRGEEAQRDLVSLQPDAIVVAAYGLMLPPDVLSAPRLGCLNVHPSLLPLYRGPSPVSAAILSGDPVTGVTLMEVDEGMDSGPIVAQQETPIDIEQGAERLTLRLFRLGADLLVKTLPPWSRGEVQPHPQDHSRATVTRRLSREDGWIDWTRSAEYVMRQVRAYQPWPGSFTQWRGRLLKVIRASVLDGPTSGAPGFVISLPNGDIGVATGDGVLGLRSLQMEGRRVVTAREFASGNPDFPGSILDASCRDGRNRQE